MDPTLHRPCLRSGYCCRKATCSVGVAFGADPIGCKFLRGDRPGEYDCRLAAEVPELREIMAIGAGCSSALNSDRQRLSRKATIRTPSARTPSGDGL